MHVAFVEQFNQHCKSKKDNCGGQKSLNDCFKFDESEYSSIKAFYETFPVMTFVFKGGAEYKWHPQEYLSNPKNMNTVFCIVVKPFTKVILGDTFMRNYDIQFDQSAKKIRFARANCGQDTNSDDSNDTFEPDITSSEGGDGKLNISAALSDQGYQFLVIYSAGVAGLIFIGICLRRDNNLIN